MEKKYYEVNGVKFHKADGNRIFRNYQEAINAGYAKIEEIKNTKKRKRDLVVLRDLHIGVDGCYLFDETGYTFRLPSDDERFFECLN